MSEFSDMELDLDDGPINENADPTENSQKSFKDAYIGFTQRTQRLGTLYAEHNEIIEPSNDFEALLEDYKCSLRKADGGDEYIWMDGTFNELVQQLNQKLSKLENKVSFLDKFTQALSSFSRVKLYLSPCNSQKGPQDTLFRALLSCAHTQVEVFNLLMSKMDGFGRSDNLEASALGAACVAQIRFLERIVDGPALVESIFERNNIASWTPSVRDALIEALPEVVTDVACQQDAALHLRDMLLQRLEREALSFQTATMRTMRLLRMSGETARKIREDLCNCIMQFDAAILPELVLFLFQTLKYDEKSSLRHILNDLSSNLKLPALRVGRSMRKVTIDDVLLEMFSKMKRFVQLEGNKGWKEIIAFFTKSGQSEEDSEANNIYKTFDYFDVLLSISLMSLDSCPLKIIAIFKNQASSTLEKYNNFQNCVDFVLTYKKVACQYITSLIALSQQCLWTSNEQVQLLGAQVYKRLFLTVVPSRELILRSMKKHLSSTSSEAGAILTILEALIKENSEAFSPYSFELKLCLDHLGRLSSDNIKRLFSILIQTSHSCTNQYEIERGITECIEKLLSSVNEKEQIWGILGILMELNYELLVNTPDREENIYRCLEKLKVACISSRLRSVMYTELSNIMCDNMRNAPSQVLLQWVDALFVSFKQDFFIERDQEYESSSPLEEANRYVNPKTSLWLNTNSRRLVEVVPLFQLLRGSALIRQRWTHDDDTLRTFNQHFTQLFFVFDANIVLNNVDKSAKSELTKTADILYLVNEWIREILNTFEGCENIDWIDPIEMKKVWSRKFRLMMETQERLVNVVKMAKKWTLPTVSPGFVDILIVDQILSKRGKKNCVEKKVKRRKKDEPKISDEEEEEAPKTPKKEVSMNRVVTVCLTSLDSHFRLLKLGTVVRCLQYLPDKIRGSTYLITEYIKILKCAEGRSVMNICASQMMVFKEIDPNFHGDTIQMWKLFIKGACEILSILNKVIVNFRQNSNANGNAKAKELLKVCIEAFCLLSETLDESNIMNNRVKEMKTRRRNQLMEQLEKNILTFRQSKGDPSQEEAEKTFLKYFISIVDLISDFEMANIFVRTLKHLYGWTEKLRRNMARVALDFLKKEWIDDEGESLKVPTKFAVTMLECYLYFRNEEDQLTAILWLLANKLAELVPDEERRKSKMSTYEEVKDPGLTKKDKQDVFHSFTRSNVTGIHKVFFSTLNNIIHKRLCPREALETGQVTIEKIISEWKIAANIFNLLCLIIRVKELRTAFLLQNALKEGKRFLFLFSRNSSFMYILEDNSRFSSVHSDAIAIIKTVQVGNRSLQNISVYAKTNMQICLLKGLPELRANAELWMRSVHTALVNLGCEEAFEIGLLKSRDIDGDEIVADEPDSQTSGEDESEVY